MLTRFGISNRLNIIVAGINIIILVVVAFLANASSTITLRTQAMERFETKADRAFRNLNTDLSALETYVTRLASQLADFETLNLASDVNDTLIDYLAEDFTELIYSVSVLRPDGTVLWVSPTTADNAPQTEPQQPLRVISAIDGVENSEIFQQALLADEPTWFLQDNAIFSPERVDTITLAVPYSNEGEQGLVWIDILQSDFEATIITALNNEGVLLETIEGYTVLLDETDTIIQAQNLSIRTLTANQLEIRTDLLLSRLTGTSANNVGLLEIRDPFNDNRDGLFKVFTFDSNNWSIITYLPESEIPVVPTDLYTPIVIVGILGIIILTTTVNRFAKSAIITPLSDLRRSATEIGEGNLRFIVFHQDKKDELGNLATAMNSMRERLRESYSELEDWSARLEDRVANRTNQLREARQVAEKNAQQLRVVYDESLSVVNETQLSPVLDAFIDRILMLLDAHYCAIWLLEDDRQNVRLVATNDTRRRTGTGYVMMPASEGIVGEAVRNDEPVIANDYLNYKNRASLVGFYEDDSPPFSRGVCAPLKFAGFAIGAVVIGRNSDDPPFDIEAQRQLTLFTNMVAPSVRNAQLFNQLQAAVQEAERANEVKTRFLATVTHELRTPLNLIINNMDFMRVGAFGDVTDDQISRLNQTVRSAEHLLYLINDLLDVSKIEAGEMQLFIQQNDVYTMLEDAVDNAYAILDTYEEKTDKVDLHVEIEEDLPEIPMDARRVRQVLNNLLSNAIKFTEEGLVSLKVFQDDLGIHFSIHDTGMGIPAEEMPKLFAAFERTDAANTKAIEGTGLGLPISQYLIQQHGSEITVVSQDNEGSTFAFTLPFNIPEVRKTDMSDTQQIKAILSSKNDE